MTKGEHFKEYKEHKVNGGTMTLKEFLAHRKQIKLQQALAKVNNTELPKTPSSGK